MKNSFFNLLLLASLFLFTTCEDSDAGDEYRIYARLNVNGLTRTYLLTLPPGYYESESVYFPLVIGMHGGGGSASQFDRDYGLTQKAAEAGFIVVYPEGVQGDGLLKVRTWNAGTCCQYAVEHNIDDVTFLRELIDELVGKYRINAKKVYATGMSNGGMMAYRLACEIPDKIAAIAAVSTTMVVTEPCHPSRAVPVLHMHSVLDLKVPYQGGVGIAGYYYPAVDSGLNVWVTENACAPQAEVVVDNNQYKFTRWTDCDDDVTIEYYLTQDGGHSWPGGTKNRRLADPNSTAINANDLLWAFFQRFELP